MPWNGRDGKISIGDSNYSNLITIREPGGEYTKKLIIRNVRMKTQHLKYSLPSTKYFGMDFPETIVLSPGMSYSIPITFRPIEYVSIVSVQS